jgi:hypothetical protein
VGLVFWIDQNTFATDLLAKIFSRKNIPFYTLESAEDFAFLIEDLKPEVLVLDHATAIASLDRLKAQYGESERLYHLPVILIGGGAQLEFITNRLGEFNRSLDPFSVPEIISKMISSH